MVWGLFLYLRARNNASPQRRTFLAPTSEGDKKHLYGQGKPMAKDASGDGADFSTGEASVADDGGGGTVQVESRLFFDGTVAPTDMSRATDAREKGRIGILGSGLSYAGSYSRVTSETIGRDLNPLGRGDGNAYVGGQLNLGRITPRLPMSTAPGGWGNSVNNGCGDSLLPCPHKPLNPNPEEMDPGFSSSPPAPWEKKHHAPHWNPWTGEDNEAGDSSLEINEWGIWVVRRDEGLTISEEISSNLGETAIAWRPNPSSTAPAETERAALPPLPFWMKECDSQFRCPFGYKQTWYADPNAKKLRCACVPGEWSVHNFSLRNAMTSALPSQRPAQAPAATTCSQMIQSHNQRRDDCNREWRCRFANYQPSMCDNPTLESTNAHNNCKACCARRHNSIGNIAGCEGCCALAKQTLDQAIAVCC